MYKAKHIKIFENFDKSIKSKYEFFFNLKKFRTGTFQKEENFIEAPAPRQERPRFTEARDREPARDRDGFTEVRRKEPPAESRADMADTWRNKTASVQRPPLERKPVEESSKEEKTPAPKPGSYVPPHLRNRAS